MEKISGELNLLIDIYADDISKTDMVKKIYRDFNLLMAKSHKVISKTDNQMLVYTALMYDKNSPISKEPLDERKKIALYNANIKDIKAQERAVMLKDDRSIAIVHYYIKYQADRKWASYVALQQTFSLNNLQILSGGGDAKEQDTVNKLVKANAELIMPELDKLENQIFGDNNNIIRQVVNFTLEDYVDSLNNLNK